MPGDDIRRIDWRLYARTDRYYMKEFEADTNTNFFVGSTCRRPCATAESRMNGAVEATYACYLAACLDVLLEPAARPRRVRGDRSRRRGLRATSAKHLQLVLHALERIEHGARDAKAAPGQTMLQAPLKKLSESLRRRSLVVLDLGSL